MGSGVKDYTWGGAHVIFPGSCPWTLMWQVFGVGSAWGYWWFCSFKGFYRIPDVARVYARYHCLFQIGFNYFFNPSSCPCQNRGQIQGLEGEEVCAEGSAQPQEEEDPHVSHLQEAQDAQTEEATQVPKEERSQEEQVCVHAAEIHYITAFQSGAQHLSWICKTAPEGL